MKVLFLNGSPRKYGYTAGTMKYIESGIGSGHSIEWIHVYDLDIKPCLSCMKCRPDGECVRSRDDGHRVWHKIRCADALIMGSPTYFGNISGPLKTLIDRSLTAFESIAASGLEMPTPLHIGKKAIMVTACNIPYPMSQLPNHGKGALSAMETALKAGGYDILGRIILDNAAAREEIPTEIKEQAKILGAQLC